MNDLQLYSAVKAIELESSLAEKMNLLRALVDTQEGRDLIHWTYNPFITFGVRVPKRPVCAGSDYTLSYNMFSGTFSLLYELASRTLTGNSARQKIEDVFKTLNKPAAELLWRILNKDLKAGVAEGLIKSVAPGLLPLFAVMRAHPYEEKRIKEFPVAVEPKLDGFRVTFVARDGGGAFLTRSGKVVESMDHMVPHVLDMLRNLLLSLDDSVAETDWRRSLTSVNGIPNVAIDGEMKGDASFEKTSGDLRRKSKDAQDVRYHVFDCMTWEEFNANGPVEVTYVRRRARVIDLMRAVKDADMGHKITQTKIKIANSHEEIEEIYQGFRNEGHEGAMVKKLDGFYFKKKCFEWMKIKPEETEDLRVVGVFQGKAGGKYENTIGGMIVDRAGVKVRVSGISDDMRDDLWSMWTSDAQKIGEVRDVGYGGLDCTEKTKSPNLDFELLGRLIEVEFHEVTSEGSLRHPRFIRFRDDKDGEIEDKELTA